jgi:hypothetical protein
VLCWKGKAHVGRTLLSAAVDVDLPLQVPVPTKNRVGMG